MSLIETVTVGSGGASSIEFTSLPQDGTDLVLLLSGRILHSGKLETTAVRFNGTTSGYSARLLYGDGSAAASVIQGSTAQFTYFWANGATSTANTFSSGQMYIANYTAATNKSVSIESTPEDNATAWFAGITAGQWANTAAITSISLNPATNFVEHTTASLYKITKGSDGITSVS
jgi:hypothetical protein